MSNSRINKKETVSVQTAQQSKADLLRAIIASMSEEELNVLMGKVADSPEQETAASTGVSKKCKCKHDSISMRVTMDPKNPLHKQALDFLDCAKSRDRTCTVVKALDYYIHSGEAEPGNKFVLNTEGLLSDIEFAQAIGVTVGTLKKWDSNGKLKAYGYDFKGHGTYTPAQVEKYLAAPFRWARWETKPEMFEHAYKDKADDMMIVFQQLMSVLDCDIANNE